MFDRREAVVVYAGEISCREFPDAAGVPWISDAAMIRVYSDDSIEIAQTRPEAAEHSVLVARGIHQFRTESGTIVPVPTGWDVSLGDWRDLRLLANGEWEPVERRPFSSTGNGDWRTVAIS